MIIKSINVGMVKIYSVDLNILKVFKGINF